MNILSLFDGISCGQVALQNLGFTNYTYYASEIHAPSIEVTQSHFPNTIQLGSVDNVQASQLPKIDLMFAGSPCQGFSAQGSQKGFEDNRSKLYYEFLRLYQEVKPKYLLFENVKMRKEWRDRISNDLGLKCVELNSNVFSAQSRTRLYWTNIPLTPITSCSTSRLSDIVGTIPQERFVYTKDMDILFNEKYKSITGVDIAYGAKSKKATWRNTNRKSFRCILRSQQVVYSIHNKVGCLTTGDIPKVAIDTTKFITLSVQELARLQGLPENYVDIISKTQGIKSIGNGWQVSTIEYLLQNIQPC